MTMLFLLVILAFAVGSALTLTFVLVSTRRPRPPLPPGGAAWPPSLAGPPPHRPPPHWPLPHGPAQPSPGYPAYNPTNFLSPGDRERILVLLRGGKKIQAIKLYREVTGAGLREAKESVEYLERFQ